MDFQKTNTYCLLFLSAVAFTVSLVHLKSILIPFVLSIFLFVSLSPLIEFISVRLKVPRWAAVLITLLVGLLSTATLGFLITVSVQDFLKSLPLYEGQWRSLLKTVESFVDDQGLRSRIEEFVEELKPSRFFQLFGDITTGALGFIGNFLLIVIFYIFLVTTRYSEGTEVPAVVKNSMSEVSKYVVAKFVISLVTGIVVALILSLIGLELAYMFGVLAFLFNFIPNIGSIIVTFLPVPIALLQFGFSLPLILTVALPGAVQVVVGIVEPKVMGQSLDLHPVTVLFFLLFWGVVWGIPGMFLAVPITVSLKILMKQLEPLDGVAEILAGRWKKSPSKL